ncbi:HAD family hydrolase [Egicoccus halophilus]|uniref:Haloacid dehalogenase n=1 Tax=Egicoccus halophilus TaxID=1670830 RepID=A0A8J3AC29_9ACTN|nr:HAD family hydrolase [Egicoccus halophilus]GGI08044.1 haloacid dehalogenase [Egicoccus halophilus]
MTTTPHLTSGILLDLDGTLVDSVHQHVVAWHEAFHAAGYTVPQWRIHAGIGMGSDRIVPWLLGRHVDDADALADDHTRRFLDTVDTLEPTEGARDLLDDLDRRGVSYIISTSASTTEREALFEVLGRDDLPYTDADAVDSSKPAPDLLLSSCVQAGIDPARAIMVGDAPWDALAALRAGMSAVAVRCGGFGDDALTGAGAQRVVDAPRQLVGQL